MFTGDAGSGESEIRKWIIEKDWLETIIALPHQMFYNTGIYTYIWIVTNKKRKIRKGKIYLINAVNRYEKMRSSLGNKRHRMNETHIDELTEIYNAFKPNGISKIFDNEDFGYHKITVERPLRLNFTFDKERLEALEEQAVFKKLANSKKPSDIERFKDIWDTLSDIPKDSVYNNRELFLKDIKKLFKKKDIKISASIIKALWQGLGQRDENADICIDVKGNAEPDTSLRDYERIPLKQDIEEYFKREVLPHVQDAWIDQSKTIVGYDIPFTQQFYTYTPPRASEDIEKEILSLEDKTDRAMKELFTN